MFRIEIQAKVLKLGLNLSAESIKRLSLINDFVCNEEHKNPHHATGLILRRNKKTVWSLGAAHSIAWQSKNNGRIKISTLNSIFKLPVRRLKII